MRDRAAVAATLKLGSSGAAGKAIEHAGEDVFKAAMTKFLAALLRPDGSIGLGASARNLVVTP